MKRSVLKKLQIASLAAGLALFVYLIKQTGLGTLLDYLGMMGWGFAFIAALSAIRNFVRAGSWYFSIGPELRNVSFWALTNIMLAGEAIKYLTATGPLLSEPAKAAMVRRQVPLLEGFSSVVVENLIYNLSVFLFMLSGLPALAWVLPLPPRLKLAGYLLGVGIILGTAAVWLVVRRRWYVMSGLLKRLAGRAAFSRSKRLSPMIERARALEENVYSFYDRRPGAFYLILALNLSAHLINVVEVYIILALIELPARLSTGFIIEAVTKVINMAFFFVPTRAGVYESGNALTLSAIGLGASAGVAIAIIRKLRAFVWVGYGLAVIVTVALKDRRATEARAAENQKARFAEGNLRSKI